MEATRTIQDLAAEGAAAFETATRPDGETTYTRKKDDAPGWVQDLLYAAHGHGELLPDDYRYEWTREALDAIADAGEDADLDDVRQEFADGVDVYTSDLLAWVGSNLNRMGYCDSATEEGLVEPDAPMWRRLAIGQYEERGEVFDAVRQALEELEASDA